MAIFVVGLVGIIVFYVLVLGVGIWAGLRNRGDSEILTMNAGRNIGWFVGTLTLIGTWCGGGYINGAAEKMFSSGLVNVQVPLGYSLALFVGAVMFIKPMRSEEYITMLDPFQQKFGYKYGALLILPAICSELFWCAAVLNSLGNTLEVVLDIQRYISIIVSACFAGLYTLVGGLVSITYTDVVQMILISTGLSLSAPFAFHNKYVDQNLTRQADWVGHIENKNIAVYIDDLLLLIFGGIPWQGYFQRIFSIRSTQLAIKMSWFSMVGTVIMAIPSLIIGYTAKITDWERTEYGKPLAGTSNVPMVLPLTLRYLVPPAVSFLGLGAVTGAVMSSADSAILASSALVSRNVYKNIFRPKASERELHWALRICVILTTVLVTVISMQLKSIYYLSFLCSDLVYVILFPQLIVTLYMHDSVNTYGSAVSYIVGFTLRILCGEHALGLPIVIKLPWFDEENNTQLFPFRSAIMVLSIIIFIVVNYIARSIFVNSNLNRKYDIFNSFPQEKEIQSSLQTE